MTGLGRGRGTRGSSCPGRGAACTAAPQSRDPKQASYVELLWAPDQQRTTRLSPRGAQHPGYEVRVALLVFGVVFVVGLAAALVRGCGLAERSRHRRLARGVGVAPHEARGDFLAGNRRGLADQTPRGT